MPLFELSETTKMLVRHLQAFEKGTVIPYHDLSNAIGEAIGPRTHNLIYARKILERDHNQIWICIRPAVGVQRLHDRDIASRLRSWWLNGARRRIDRGGEESSTVDTKLLDIDEQTRFSVDCIQRELTAQALSRGAWKQLEKVARGTSNDLPSFNIVEWAISLTPRKIP